MGDYLSGDEDSGVMPNPQTPAPSIDEAFAERTATYEPEAEAPLAPRCAGCFRADRGSRIYIVTPVFFLRPAILCISFCWWAMERPRSLCERCPSGHKRPPGRAGYPH